MDSSLPDYEKLLRQRELADLLHRREALKTSNGLAFYKPHAKQDLFHRAAWINRRFARTSNRFGKTTMGTAEDISFARGERIFYPNGDTGRTVGIPKRSTKGVIIVEDWDKAKSIFTSEEVGQSRGKIWQMLPEGWIDGVDQDKQGNLYRFRVKSIYGGISTIQLETIRSFKTNPMGHESEQWDWIHADEPMPREMFVAYARGFVDHGGSAWFCCTPLTEMWINDYFIPRELVRDEFDGSQTFDVTSKGQTVQKTSKSIGKRWVITGTIWENPHLGKVEIDNFVADIPESERATRLEGRPKALAGAIYTEFDRNVHVYYDTPAGWSNDYTPPQNYLIKYAIDPHPSTPHAVLFMAISPYGYVYFYADIFRHCLVKDLSAQIHEVPGGSNPFKCIIDPLAVSESSTGDGTTMADDFRENGIYPDTAVKDLERGILKVKALLAKRDCHGKPVVRFNHNCLETIFEFDRYVWDKKMAKPDPRCPDHMMENLYRLVLDGLEYTDPTAKSFSTIMPRTITQAMLDLPRVEGPSGYFESDPVKAWAQPNRYLSDGESLPFNPYHPDDYQFQ